MAAPSKTGNRDSSQLAIAAEELIKAACTHVDSTSIALGKETVNGLKELSAGSAALKASVDAKLNTLNQSISTLKEEVVKQNTLISNLKAAIDVQTKDQKIQGAISNADLNAFNYYEKTDNSYNIKAISSSAFVKSVLLEFNTGNGKYITNRSMSSYWLQHYRDSPADAKSIENGETQFREKLSQQIHELLGQKPRVDKAANGYAILYS